ncbi:hypothetical protein IMZ48_24870 [Candidatus Bathyarchaeota archaeon]|nr:hypothetical protein [Candidatus Bathyarchaeota archaeon]
MTTDSQPPSKASCAGADCGNEAGTLQCPSCLKLGLKDSYFCSQDCFKRNWVCPCALILLVPCLTGVCRMSTRRCTRRPRMVS